MMVFIKNRKLHVSAYSGHHLVLTTFLLQELYITCIICVYIYITLIERKLSKPEDGRCRPKHVVFSIANKYHHLSIYL